jgi:hypothetical protein
MTSPTANATAATAGTGVADRYLCSSVHLSDGFARHVLAALAAPSLDALGPSPGVDLVALARHATFAVRRYRLLHGQLAAVLVGAVVLASAAPFAVPEATVPWLCLTAVGAWGAAFAILLVHRLTGYRHVLAIRDDAAPPRDGAPPLSAGLERHLAAAMDSNVVVFSGGAPFVGSGQVLSSWKLNVNCLRPAVPGGQVRPFAAADLHKELTLAARGAGIPGLSVRNRLFVAGTAVDAVTGLLDDPMRRPAPKVGAPVLREGIVHPQPAVRTYLCLQKVSWDGDLVVEVFVRVERTGGYLFVENHSFVLLPLRAELCVAAHLPRHLAGRAVLRCARGAFRALLRSPAAVLRDVGELIGHDKVLTRQRRQVRRSPAFDYGAVTGLREQAASPERFHLFAYSDEDRDLGILRQAILESISDFLHAHGVDTSEFTRQQTSIVNNSYSIGSISNGSHNFGAGGTVVQQGGAPGQPAGAAPWAPVAAP